MTKKIAAREPFAAGRDGGGHGRLAVRRTLQITPRNFVDEGLRAFRGEGVVAASGAVRKRDTLTSGHGLWRTRQCPTHISSRRARRGRAGRVLRCPPGRSG